jgi:3-phosphoshikimate 1-carboxyvinyltransferase
MSGSAPPEALEVRPPGPFDAEIVPPGSKSVTNRVLPLAAIAHGASVIRGWLDAEDTALMTAAVRACGATVERSPGGELVVVGLAGPLRPAPGTRLEVGTAGTVARFLTALLAASEGQVTLDGSPRMRERPMADLVRALEVLGASFDFHGVPGALPFVLRGAGAVAPRGPLVLERPPSSQFVSALLLLGPLLAAPLELVLPGGTPARPYVDMTLQVLTRFGVEAGWSDPQRLRVEPGPATATDFLVEPDASGATYPMAAAAIFGGKVRIPGLGSASLQGDAAFVQVLERMGAIVSQTADTTVVSGAGWLRGAQLDLSQMPDTALTAAVVALWAVGPTRIHGVEVLRHHESDRIAAAAVELRKLGAVVEERPDGLSIEPPAGGPRRGVRVSTYRDHRMAMAFALAGHVTIEDPACVNKTYPGYFNELGRLGMVDGMPRSLG